METRSKMIRVGLASSLLSLAALAAVGTARAQSAAEETRPVELDPVEGALVTTLQTGRPTFLLVVSRSHGEAHRLWRQMLESPQARGLAQTAQFVELVAEDHPSRVRQLGVTSAPVVCAIRRNESRIEKVAQRAVPREAGHLLQWIEAIGEEVATTAAPPRDADLTRTHFPQQDQASPQAPPLAAPPKQAMTPPTTTTQLQAVPVLNAPSQPPVAVAMPSHQVYIQPSAPTVVLGPTPPPNIVVTQTTPSTPTITMAVPVQSPPTTITPSPQSLVAQPSPQSVLAVPQNTFAPVAAAPQPAAGPTTVGLVLTNPGPIDRCLGALGRMLAQRGMPRLQLTQAQQIALTPAMLQTLQGGTAGPPQQLYTGLQEQVCPTRPVSAPTPSPQQPVTSRIPPPGIYPSPQSQSHTLFSRLFGHD